MFSKKLPMRIISVMISLIFLLTGITPSYALGLRPNLMGGIDKGREANRLKDTEVQVISTRKQETTEHTQMKRELKWNVVALRLSEVDYVIKADDGELFRFKLGEQSRLSWGVTGYSVAVFCENRKIGYAYFKLIGNEVNMDVAVPDIYTDVHNYEQFRKSSEDTRYLLFRHAPPAIVVNEDFRYYYRGIGSALMFMIIRFCYENGIQKLTIGGNYPIYAPDFFKKLGFHEGYISTTQVPREPTIHRKKPDTLGPNDNIEPVFNEKIRSENPILARDKEYEIRIPFNRIRSVIIEVAKNKVEAHIALNIFLKHIRYFKPEDLYSYSVLYDQGEHMGPGRMEISPGEWDHLQRGGSSISSQVFWKIFAYDIFKVEEKIYCDRKIAELSFEGEKLLDPKELRKAIDYELATIGKKVIFPERVIDKVLQDLESTKDTYASI